MRAAAWAGQLPRETAADVRARRVALPVAQLLNLDMRRVLSRKRKWVVSQFENDFTLDIDKIPDPKGDRVRITMNGQVPRGLSTAAPALT